MRYKSLLAAAALAISTAAVADLEPWKDYEASKSVMLVTTVKVDSNMEDAYLEGLRKSWIPGNEIAKELGQIEDRFIWRSDLSESGDFNLILGIKLASAEYMDPNKKRYDDFLKEYTKQASDEATDFAQENYPAMREITGTYMMRKITVK